MPKKPVDSFVLANNSAGIYRGYGNKFKKANESKTLSNIGFDKPRLIKRVKNANVQA